MTSINIHETKNMKIELMKISGGFWVMIRTGNVHVDYFFDTLEEVTQHFKIDETVN